MIIKHTRELFGKKELKYKLKIINLTNSDFHVHCLQNKTIAGGETALFLQAFLGSSSPPFSIPNSQAMQTLIAAFPPSLVHSFDLLFWMFWVFAGFLIKYGKWFQCGRHGWMPRTLWWPWWLSEVSVCRCGAGLIQHQLFEGYPYSFEWMETLEVFIFWNGWAVERGGRGLRLDAVIDLWRGMKMIFCIAWKPFADNCFLSLF